MSWREWLGGFAFGVFQLTHEWQHVFAEVFDLLLEVQKAAQHEIDAHTFVSHDALGNLSRRTDEVGAEAVVVLNQVFERRGGPVALPFGRRFACLFYCVTKRVDGFDVGLGDDFGQHAFGLFFGVARDDEGVHTDLGVARISTVTRRFAANVLNLLGDFLGAVAVGEIPIRDARGHVTRAA